MKSSLTFLYALVEEKLGLQHFYLSETESTVINFDKTLELCDWLSKTNNLFIYSLDTVYKDIDMNIYIRCYSLLLLRMFLSDFVAVFVRFHSSFIDYNRAR